MDRHRRGHESDWGALLWVLWEGSIRPRLIPGTDIDSLAAAMVDRHGGESGGDGLYRRGPGLALFAPFRARKVAAGAETDRAPGNIRKKMRTTRHRVVLDEPRNSGGKGGARPPEQRACAA